MVRKLKRRYTRRGNNDIDNKKTQSAGSGTGGHYVGRYVQVQESYPQRHSVKKSARTTNRFIRNASSSLLDSPQSTYPHHPTWPPSNGNTFTPVSPLTFLNVYLSKSYLAYEFAASLIARMWCGRPLAATACARDCQIQVARLRPVTGSGIPYQ